MPSYKLCYFNARGVAEMLRFTFAEAGVEFEDVRYTSESWPQNKPNMLFGQVPVLFVDGEQVAHSRAALRYVGREFKLDGRDSLTAAKVDMWIEVLVEGLSKIRFSETDEKKRAEMMAAVVKDDLSPRLAKLETAIKGDYIFGDNPTIADFGVYCLVKSLQSRTKEEFLVNFPKIQKMMKSVENRPNIAKWIEKRPVTEN